MHAEHCHTVPRGTATNCSVPFGDVTHHTIPNPVWKNCNPNPTITLLKQCQLEVTMINKMHFGLLSANYDIYASKWSLFFATNIIFCHSQVTYMEVGRKNGKTMKLTFQNCWHKRQNQCTVTVGLFNEWQHDRKLCLSCEAAEGHITWSGDQVG